MKTLENTENPEADIRTSVIHGGWRDGAVILAVLAGIVGSFALPGPWGNMALVLTPVWGAALVVGRFFKETFTHLPEAHGPLIALGSFYTAVCLYAVWAPTP